MFTCGHLRCSRQLVCMSSAPSSLSSSMNLSSEAGDGYIYAAARDCLQALVLDPGHVKDHLSHLRLAQCLLRSWSGLQRRPSASSSTIIKSAIRSSLNPKLSYNWPEIWR